MSEYQYYEFRAIDRPLNEQELRSLHLISTRGEITPTSYVNTYSWGDFKGNPDRLMETSFDAFVHVANWGARRFVLRLPATLLRPEFLSSCCRGDSLQSRRADEFCVIDFQTEKEPGDWLDGEGWMASLLPLRADLMRGDDRCLYLGWLCCAQSEELHEDELEPPVPAGLQSLSGSLKSFIEFMDLGDALVEVAARASEQPAAAPARDDLSEWVRAMPSAEKDALLVEAALTGRSQTGIEILRQFGMARRTTSDSKSPPNRRTVGELLAAADKLASEKARQLAERQAAEEERKVREAAEARTRYLDQLAEREAATWQNVTMLVQTKQPDKYGLAVSLLVDLRDLAARDGRDAQFRLALAALRGVHSAKPSFLRRLAEAGL